MIILGVDPGSIRTGYGVVAARSRDAQRLLEQGVLCPSARLALPERLRQIHEGVCGIIDRFHPDILAVEDVFHAVNTRTALVLGHVRGIVLLAGAEAGLRVETYPPATIKLQIAGFGRADKAQVAHMVARYLNMPLHGKPGDAADALAVALCHAFLQHQGRKAV